MAWKSRRTKLPFFFSFFGLLGFRGESQRMPGIGCGFRVGLRCFSFFHLRCDDSGVDDGSGVDVRRG